MARPSKAERLAAIHAEALAEYNRVWSATNDVRQLSRQARRFVAVPGAQWEGPWQEQFENRPRLEVNKVLLAVIRIYNEMRNNRITVDFVPKDGSEDELADTLDGLFRADWEDSCGDEAIDNAFDEAVAGGMGAFRLRACLEDEYDDENEHQRIRLEPIYDADTSVFFDLDAKRYDKSDARHAWVLYSLTNEAFKARYGIDPASWPKSTETGVFDWCQPKVTYIAEYYRVEDERIPMVRFKMPDGTEHDFDAEDVEEAFAGEEGLEYDEIRLIEATGGVIVKEWRKRCRRVRKLIMSGGQVLEDCGYIAGKHIPIIPVYGKRWFIDNIERCIGVAQPAMDMQRLKNMQISKLAETAALSATEKPIVFNEQVSPYAEIWANDNLKNYAYLPIDPLTDANGQIVASGPVAYTKLPQVPPAMAALLQLTEQDMADVLGNNQSADQMVSNISAKAVEMIQQRTDMQSFIYMSNLAKSLRRAGEVWLSMAAEIYVDEGRSMKTVGAMGDSDRVKLLEPAYDKNGKPVMRNDLRRAKMDVTVDVGPSFTSRRDATVQKLVNMLQFATDPADQKVLTAQIMMNMEGEGLADTRDYYRKQLVQLGVVPPTDDEDKAMRAAKAEAANQPDPQAAYLMAEAAKAEAQAVKAQADTQRAVAETKKAEADAIATLAGIETDQAKVAIDAAKAIGAGMR